MPELGSGVLGESATTPTHMVTFRYKSSYTANAAALISRCGHGGSQTHSVPRPPTHA